MQNLQNQINTNLQLAKNYTDNEIQKLSKTSKDYTDNKILALYNNLSKAIEDIAVASGHKAIKWLWQYGCCAGGLNAFEWYMMTPVTAEEWSNLKFTCRQWYTTGRRIFKHYNPEHHMFSPVTGKYSHIKKVIYELGDVIKKDAITASEYDELSITAAQYAQEKLSAYEYDWNGKEIKNVFSGNSNTSLTSMDTDRSS